MAAVEASGPSAEPANTSKGVFKICHDQTYALCAVASCFVFNNVSYCTCDVKKGDSISIPFKFGKGKDICSVNAEGAGNGYMMSTYSLPKSVVAPHGDKALYTCPAATSTGAYAQCDGGVCFRSTPGPELSRLDQTSQAEPDHLLLPDHRSRSVNRQDRLPDRRPLSLREQLLQELRQ